MDYNTFIEKCKKHETSRIKTVLFPASCCMHQIPEKLANLIPDIIHILDQNIHKLCGKKQIVAIFGMQLAPFTQKTHHLCCVLSYLPIRLKDLDSLQTWKEPESVVIDFSTGEVMSNERYLSWTTQNRSCGEIYGKINSSLLLAPSF